MDVMWTGVEQAAYRAACRMRQLFAGEHEAFFVLPNGAERRYEYVTVNWLGDVLSQTWKRLLFRQFPVLAIDGDAAQQAAAAGLVAALDLPGVCLPTALVVSYAGQATWKLYWSPLTGRPALRLWGARDDEFVTWDYLPADPARPCGVSFWYHLALPGADETAWVRERHQLMARDGALVGVRTLNTVHRTVNGLPGAETLPWEFVWPDPATRPPAEAFAAGLTALPAVAIHNVDRDGDRRGDSDYTTSLIALQRNLNKLVAARQLVIDLSEQPQVIVPPEYVDERGDVDWSQVRLRIRYPGEDGVEIKTVNWSGNLENSGAQWEHYRTEFQALTGIAPALLGRVASNESGYARRLGLVPTEAEVGARRRGWEPAFTQALHVAMALDAVFGGSPVPPVTRVATHWPSVIPEDAAEISGVTVAEYRDGVRSLESAVARLNPAASPAWLAAEVARLLAG